MMNNDYTDFYIYIHPEIYQAKITEKSSFEKLHF